MPSAIGQFFVVATPIGNLADLSPHARSVLSTVDGLFCEDTRVALKLYEASGMASGIPRLFRCDENVEYGDLEKTLAHIEEGLNAGKNYALISDAGTPGISDPGARLISQLRTFCKSDQIKVVAGPSALSAFMSICGEHAQTFSFFGFYPRTQKESDDALNALVGARSKMPRTGVWYESPRRILDSLKRIDAFFEQAGEDSGSNSHDNLQGRFQGYQIEIVVAKELTKRFEKHFVGSPNGVLVQVEKEISEQGQVGEWVFAIKLFKSPSWSQERRESQLNLLHGERAKDLGLGNSFDQRNAHTSESENGHPFIADDVEWEESWTKALQCLVNAGVPIKDCALQVSKVFGIKKRQAYDVALKLAGKKV